MRKTFACGAAFLLICCCALAAGAQGKRYLRAVQTLTVEGKDENGKDRKVSAVQGRLVALEGRRATVDLEVGEEIGGHDILLQPEPGAATKFKVEQRFETVLTISHDDALVVLSEWKHYRSEWMTLDGVGENRFRIREASREDEARFPDVTPEEIRQAVWGVGGERWAELVKDVKGPHDPPAEVRLSKITLRVSVKEGDDWKVIHLIDFLLPMRC